MYGQVYFHDFEIILQFLLCGSCICSSLLWSVGNSSVLHEYQESRGAHLGVKSSPQFRTPHLQLLLLPVGEVSVLCLCGHGPSGEHCRYCKPSTFFTAWPFTIILHFSLPLKNGLLLFIGTF